MTEPKRSHRHKPINAVPTALFRDSDRRLAPLVRPDAHHFLQREDKHFTVADLSSLRGFDDELDRLARNLISHGHFDFHLGQKIDGVFIATIDLRVSFGGRSL